MTPKVSSTEAIQKFKTLIEKHFLKKSKISDVRNLKLHRINVSLVSKLAKLKDGIEYVGSKINNENNIFNNDFIISVIHDFGDNQYDASIL